ncbi:xylanase [Rhodococcus sp. ABRD24]|nr:xylanase [Rhodococcus sp. ABRD24]
MTGSRKLSWIGRPAFGLAAAACLALGSAGIAGADSPGPTLPNLVTFKNLATSKCLDGNSVTIYTHDCNGGLNQNWLISARPGATALRNMRTTLCLDSNAIGTVYPYPCNGGANQQWTWVWNGTSGTLQNVATGRFLDSNGIGTVYTMGGNGGSYQKWL